MQIDRQCWYGLESCNQGSAHDEEENEKGGNGRVVEGHDPAIWYKHNGSDVHQAQANLQPRSLDRKAFNTGLSILDEFDAELTCVAAEVEVHDATNDGTDEERAKAYGQVAEADLDGVEVVSGSELLWEGGEDDVVSCVDDTGEEEKEECFFVEDDWHCSQEAR